MTNPNYHSDWHNHHWNAPREVTGRSALIALVFGAGLLWGANSCNGRNYNSHNSPVKVEEAPKAPVINEAGAHSYR